MPLDDISDLDDITNAGHHHRINRTQAPRPAPHSAVRGGASLVVTIGS
jgi:hypothetical protein